MVSGREGSDAEGTRFPRRASPATRALHLRNAQRPGTAVVTTVSLY